MSLSINTNAASLQAQMSLSNMTSALQQNQEKLSTGLRINSAADDAAGLTITDGMTSQIKGMNQAVRNANDGISLAQTAEGGLQEITNMLQRMRELAIQAANDTNTQSDRDALNSEFTQLQEEVTRVAQSTNFNGEQVLRGVKGGNDTLDIQVGANTSGINQITLTLKADMVASALGTDAATVNATVSVGSASDGSIASATLDGGATGALSAVASLDTAIGQVDAFRSELGAKQNRLDSSIANLENSIQNLTESRSRILDADIAKQSAEMTQNNVRQQASAAVLAQANQQPQIALQLLG